VFNRQHLGYSELGGIDASKLAAIVAGTLS